LLSDRPVLSNSTHTRLTLLNYAGSALLTLSAGMGVSDKGGNQTSLQQPSKDTVSVSLGVFSYSFDSGICILRKDLLKIE